MSLMYSLVVRMDVKDLGVSPVYNPGGGMENPEARYLTYGCIQDTSHALLVCRRGENAGAHGGFGIPAVYTWPSILGTPFPTCEPSLSARTHHIASQPLTAVTLLW